MTDLTERALDEIGKLADEYRMPKLKLMEMFVSVCAEEIKEREKDEDQD